MKRIYLVLLLLISLGSTALAGSLLDITDDTANDCYIIVAYDTADTNLEYWELKIDKQSASLYSFKDLTDDGDGQGDHTNYMGASAYDRKCSLLGFDGRGGNAFMRRSALVDLDDRLSFTATGAASSATEFTITYAEDALSTDFFHDSYSTYLYPGDLLTTITLSIKPPTVDGTVWDWSIECENVSGGAMDARVWYGEYVYSFMEDDIAATLDSDGTLADGAWDSQNPESYMRWTVGSNSLGLTEGREFIVDYQDGLSGEALGGIITSGDWAGFDYGRYSAAYSNSGTELPDQATRTNSGQMLIDIAAEPDTATLSYVYGTTNTTYHYRPLTITASLDTDDIWEMTLFTPESGYDQTGHDYWLAGEIASFRDLAYGGTAFEYSPEAGSSRSSGLMRMTKMEGDFDDTSGQTGEYYEFTKTDELATGVTGVLTVRINAPTVSGDEHVTVLDGSFTVTNNSGAVYNLRDVTTAGSGSLNLSDGGYDSWAFVNPDSSTSKPNLHLTDTTDGHQLYEVYDWYGSTVTSSIPGLFMKAVVKDNAYATALNMRSGLTFELRSDDMDLYYVDYSDTMRGSTTLDSYNDVCCRLNSLRGAFGNGASLADGESVTLEWEGVISTLPTYIPPIADAGSDFEQIDTDDGGDETVTLDATNSFDPDGSIVSYVWYEGETQLATGATPSLTLDVGLHTLTLIVTDDDNESDSDEIIISIRGKDGYTYYIDYDNGDDTNSGRYTTEAWKHCPGDANATDNPAQVSLTQGDRIIFKGGVVYRGLVTCEYSGVAGNPIIYDGNSDETFGTGRAILDGSEELTGWTQCASAAECDDNPNYANIYYTWLPAGIEIWQANLYEDDGALNIAQDPNRSDAIQFDKIYEWITFDSATSTTITDSSYFTQIGSDYWDGSTYVLIHAGAGLVYFQPVTGFDPASNEIQYESLGTVTHYNVSSQPDQAKYVMSNSLKILDTAGEYVVRKDQTDANGGYKVYLWPLTSGISGKTITVSMRKNCMHLTDESYITIRNFKIQKATGGLGDAGEDGCALRNGSSDVSGISVVDNVFTMNRTMERLAAISLDRIDGCVIDSNEIYENFRSGGIQADRLSNSKISNNYLRKNGATAMSCFYAEDCEILDNTILDHRGVHSNGMSLYMNCDGVLVKGNTILDGQTGITLQESENLEIAYNIITTTVDSYVVASWGSCDSVCLYNNVIRNFEVAGKGVHFSEANNTNIVAKNNIIDGSDVFTNGFTSEYNIYTSRMHNQDNLSTGEFDADADDLWVDPDGDYHLLSNSAAIDAGVVLGYSSDFEGNSVPAGSAPDIGAYEYTSGTPGDINTEIPGDANGDGSVNLDDFIILRQNYGTASGASWSMGDFNDDGVVNLDDFIILKQNYGKTSDS